MKKYVVFGGCRISYRTLGTGSPVMLLHGFGEDSTIWDAQVSFLQDKYFLIIPDLPGTAESDLLKKENVSLIDYAEVIKAILVAEKISVVTMIGHSMGGYITLAFAEKYPEILKAFGLVHSGAYADDEEKIQTRKKSIAFIKEHGSGAFLQTAVPGLFLDQDKNKEDIDLLIAKGSTISQEALIQYYTAMIERPDRTSVLKSFPEPILFIIGEHDKATPFKHSLQQSHLPAHAYINILRNSAHMGMKEEPEKANEILAQFLHSVN